MTAQPRLKRGDRVRVRANDQDDWTPAFVALASDTDPSSVLLVLDGMVHAAAGQALTGGGLPLTVDYAAETITSLIGDSYEIEVA